MTLVKLKYNPLVQNLEGKNVVMVDDSLVRGNTISQIINLVRSAGAKTVHVRIASPPIRHPCYMGIDMKTKEELIASFKTVDEIKEIIGADSLGYLSHEGMINAIHESDIHSQHKQSEAETKSNQDKSTNIKSSESNTEKKESVTPAKPESKSSEEVKQDKTVPSSENNPTPVPLPTSDSKSEVKQDKPSSDNPIPEPTPAPQPENKQSTPPVETKDLNPKSEVKKEPTQEKPQTVEPKTTSSQASSENGGAPRLGFCSACFTGEYPLDIEDISYNCGLDL